MFTLDNFCCYADITTTSLQQRCCLCFRLIVTRDGNTAATAILVASGMAPLHNTHGKCKEPILNLHTILKLLIEKGVSTMRIYGKGLKRSLTVQKREHL